MKSRCGASPSMSATPSTSPGEGRGAQTTTIVGRGVFPEFVHPEAGSTICVIDEPDRFSNLARVRLVPSLVAGFIGLLAGRAAWLLVSYRLGVDEHVPFPWLAIVLAAFAARRAVRMRPATALRSE